MKSFVELTGKEKLIELLRWIGVLPAALFGLCAGNVASGMLLGIARTVGIVQPPSEMGLNRFVRYGIWLFPMGLAFIIAGALMAPRFRLAAASVLAVLWILWTGTIHRWGHEATLGAVVSAACGVAGVFYFEKSRVRRPSRAAQLP
jgi:hypothetical protein